MSRRKRKVVDYTEMAADRGTEDGSDPKEFHAKPWHAPKKASRKGLQLCGQVKQALELAIRACADARLRELCVLEVRPAPHSGRLLVLLGAPEGADLPALRQAIAGASGFLRREVAGAIHRRHAPELIFEV